MANNPWKLEGVACRSEYYEYYSQLSRAFKADCETLLLAFAEHKTFSFKVFAEIWRKMEFGIIFVGQEVIEETIFPEGYIFIIKKYIIFSRNIYVQIGGFYLLYGFYYKQPSKTPVKIRWTKEEYHYLKLLVAQMKDCKEFMFIFNKMKFDEAFLYVVKTRPWGMDLKYMFLEKTLKNNIFDNNEYPTLIKGALKSDSFCSIQLLQNVTEEYEEELNAFLAENPCAELSIQKSTLVDYIKEKCDEMDKNSKKYGIDIKDEDTTYMRRQQIKRKAVQRFNIKSESAATSSQNSDT